MNKSDLVGSVAKELGCSRVAAARSVEAVLGSIAKGIESSGSVTISGFGSFSRRHRSGRMVRNPSTGEPNQVAPSVSVGFRPGIRLRKLVNH